MAVPSAVIRQREKLQADFVAAGLGMDGRPVDTQPVDLDTPIAAPVVEQSPQVIAPAPDVSALNAKIQELEHLLKTRDGQTSKAATELNDERQRAQIMASQVSSLEETVATLQRQVEQAEARATAKSVELPSLDMPEDLTPDEREKFGNDSIGFVEKLTKKQLIAYFKPLIEKVGALEKQVSRVSELDKLPALEKTVKNNEVEAQRLKEEEFFRSEVLAYFQDFDKVRDTQGWKDFLLLDIPGKGIKNVHLLNQHRLVHNAQGIRSLIQSFYETLKEKPTLASIATPRGAQTEGMPVVKPKVKASEYQKNLRLFTARRLPQAEWDKFKADFKVALDEDRVEHDVRL